MINVEKVLKRLPNFNQYCSVEDLNKLVDTLRDDERFSIQQIGLSEEGRSLEHVRFGKGQTKALFVAFPHCDEPIGGMTVYSLLTLLKNNCTELVNAGIEWHFVPCIDPDGAILNEGWSQDTVTAERIMKYFHKQNLANQVECSFPIDHKKLQFNKPTKGTQALMRLFAKDCQPDFYATLHNSLICPAFFYINRDIGSDACNQIHSLLSDSEIPLQIDNQRHTAETYAEGIFGIPSISGLYDDMEGYIEDPSSLFPGGASSYEYIEKLVGNKCSPLVFVSELSYMEHPLMDSQIVTDQNYRKVLLEMDANRKYLRSLVYQEWNNTKDDLDVDSPFYLKVYPEMIKVKERLAQGLGLAGLNTSQILFNDTFDRKARETDIFTAYMWGFRFLCHEYAFVRLLHGSNKTQRITDAIDRLEAIFDAELQIISDRLDFTKLKAIDVNKLVKLQLGSTAIALNSILQKQQSDSTDNGRIHAR